MKEVYATTLDSSFVTSALVQEYNSIFLRFLFFWANKSAFNPIIPQASVLSKSSKFWYLIDLIQFLSIIFDSAKVWKWLKSVEMTSKTSSLFNYVKQYTGSINDVGNTIKETSQ